MSKIRVAIAGTVGKSVSFDPNAGARAEAAVAALAAQISAGVGGTILHRNLQQLQVGDDHPQYAMWQAPENIQGLWNFATIPLIQGETLAEYIEDVVGGDFFDFLQDTPSVVWTYYETDNELEANVPPEFVQDTVGAMLTDSTSIDFTYNDGAGTFTASTINANPTGTIGLAAVNGVAATPMRSDAAPALSQAIAPTWSATHTFSLTPVVPNDSWTYAKIQNVSATSRVLGRISSGAGDIEELTGANLATILGSAIPSGANPTASVGLSVVNGSAASFLRSDGAPALSQSISPVWTGSHSFRADSDIGGAVTDPRFTFDVATLGRMLFIVRNAPANEGRWRFVAAGSEFAIQTLNDAESVANSLMHFYRSGATPILARMPFDNYELQIGAGQDLRQYHDGTNSWIRNDTGILKLSAGTTSVFEVTAARGTFNVPARLRGYTVATLPAGVVGDSAYVTDALAPAFLGAVAGGGAVTCTVFYNGAAWVVQ